MQPEGSPAVTPWWRASEVFPDLGDHKLLQSAPPSVWQQGASRKQFNLESFVGLFPPIKKRKGYIILGKKKEKKEKATFTRQMWKMLFNPKVILSPPQKGWTRTLVTSPNAEDFHAGSVWLLHGAIQSTIWIPPPRLMFRENEKSIPYKQRLPENFLEGWR